MEQPHNPRTPELRSLDAAQKTADWLPTYLYSNDHEPAGMSEVSVRRLKDIFGETNAMMNLTRLKALFPQLNPEEQAAVGLYIAGYDDQAIDALSEVAVTDALHRLRELIDDTDTPAIPTVKQRANGGAYFPLKTVTDILARAAHIDEEKFMNDRAQIQQLTAEVLETRTGWAMQYLPASSVAVWKMILNDWLGGMTLDELEQAHSLPAGELTSRLGRIAKVLLREPATDVQRPVGRMNLEWQDRAACLNVDGDAFFPEKGHSGAYVKKKVCGICPVSDECRQYKKQVGGSSHGIWGGASKVRRKKPRSA